MEIILFCYCSETLFFFAFHFRFIILLQFIFVYGVREESSLFFSSYGYQFIEKTIFIALPYSENEVPICDHTSS